MKIILLFLITLFLFTTLSFSQFNNYPRQDEGVFSGGVGLTWIDGKPYYRIGFRPEVSFDNFGVGLDLNLDFDSDGNFRRENFNEFSDYLSVIRYVRYGIKNDPVFFKLGALDYYSIGHGTIMHQYNNSPTFDARKIGLIADIDFGQFGFESIYSAFGEDGIIGFRGYVRPLQFTSASEIPIISMLEVGATFVSDFNENAGVISGNYNIVDNHFQVLDDKGAINAIGIDLGLPLISSGAADLVLYLDYNKIINFGSGVAAGIKLDLNGLGLFNLSAKLERRFNGDNYLPSYFNALYEVERFRLNNSTGELKSKVQQLESATNNSDGFYGDLYVNALGMFDIFGAYQRLDEFPNSGILNLRTEVAPEDAPFVARAGYDKINIQDGNDLFKLDDRSFLFAEVGYKPVEYLLVSIVYNWTFTPVRDNDDNVINYEAQKRIEPRISFIYPFKL
jgi:hypothetical protein